MMFFPELFPAVVARKMGAPFSLLPSLGARPLPGLDLTKLLSLHGFRPSPRLNLSSI